jgi:hypothetical protein
MLGLLFRLDFHGQLGQSGPASIGLLARAAARALVEIITATRAKAKAIGFAEGLHGFGR